MPPTTPNGHGLGRIADLGDIRDYRLAAPPQPLAELPPSMDLRSSGFLPPVWDQGQLGSCTSFATDAAVMFDLAKQHEQTFEPSHLFQYYNARSLEGTTRSDAGATIRDAIKAAGQYGTAPATDWPYDPKQFAKKPSRTAYKDALKHTALVYRAVPQSRAAISGVIASGYPIVAGISVYASFESADVARTGQVPLPAKGEQLLGGHAILWCGYDANGILFRNSWGQGWAQQGYAHLPWDYVTNADLASDFWLVQTEK